MFDTSVLQYSTWSIHYALLSFSLLIPILALFTPSANLIFLAKLAASSYFCLASSVLPCISKNSPRLCVATAQPTSHSSVRSGALIWPAWARALVAHVRAWSMRRVRGAELFTGKSVGADERVGAEDEGGVCCARQVDILFTKRVSRGGRLIYTPKKERKKERKKNLLRTTPWHEFGGHSCSAFTNKGVAR